MPARRCAPFAFVPPALAATRRCAPFAFSPTAVLAAGLRAAAPLAFALAALAAAACAPLRAAAAPAAGTAIANTAAASTGGAPIPSNTVVAIVQRADSLALGPDRGVLAAPGANVSFAHRLRNDGNATADVRLDLANLGADGFDLAALTLIADRNGDGVADAGDATIANGGTVTMVPGDSLALLVTGTVPAAAPASALARVRLTATTTGGGVTAMLQDSVTTPIASAPPALAFYAAPDYAQTTRVAALGQPLYVQALAPGCDLDPSAPDTIALTLTARPSGDRGSYRAVETGAATGVFRIEPAVVTAQLALGVASANDGILSLQRGDEVTADLNGCGAPLTEAHVWIEPYGVVFDARNGTTVAGARVALIDVSGGGNGGAAGQAANVWQSDGVTPAPATVVSDAQGRFQFPRVAPSTYRLVVGAPAPYAFPAQVAPASLPAGFLVDAAASYGAPFATTQSDAPIAVDLPVDPGPQVTLFAEKTASRPSVEPGEVIDFAVQVANRSDSALAAVAIHDALPPGFAYVPGSARRDGAVLADPAGAPGPQLDFALGAVNARATATLRYRTRVGAGAVAGEAVNRAQAAAGGYRSNDALARVQVLAGLFAQEGTIVGAVFLDRAGTRRGEHQTGIAGVRLWLDDGTYSVTDGEGRFTFTGVTPRTHALKVDAATLPAGARLVAVDHRDEDRPGLRFVDLTRGELQRAEFAVTGDTATVRETGERHLAAAGRGDELSRQMARGTTPLIAAPGAGDTRALPSEAIVAGEAITAPPPPATAATAVPAVNAAPDGGAVTLDQLARTLDPDLGFVGIADLDTVASNQIAVRVKGRIGTTLALRLNGQRVPETRVGMRVTVPEAGVEAWEYVGLTLEPGVNLLEVAPPHSVGRIAVRVVAPGPLARLVLDAPARVPADGHATARLHVRASDAAGIPVGARTLVTLECSAGALQAVDLDPAAPGIQIAVEGGEASVPIGAPASPADCRVIASAGALRAETRIRFVPDLRPLLAVGALEGVVGLGGGGSFAHDGNADAASFESTIDQFASVRRDGRAMAAAHGAMFVKGRVRDDVSLTLGYDSDRPRDLRQFRDLQPDAAYPLYGDGATRGYEAQSTGRLYARLDRGSSSMLYGDFLTRGAGGTPSLAAYSRSLTGAQAHWDERGVQVDAFSSRDRSHLKVEELAGLGISGPYTLAGAPLVENSERVEILVRDRNQPSLVLSTTARQRFTDYEIEPLTGRLTLRAPVPSVDAALNPVSIRVTYESVGDGDAFWVSGVEATTRIGSRFEAGGTYVDDHDPERATELRGARVAGDLSPHTQMIAEVASSRVLGADPGYGSRLELTHESPGAQGRLWASATGARFDNPSAGFAPGRTEGGARLSTRLAGTTHFAGEALWSADAFGNDRRAGLLATVDRPLAAALRGEFGVRLADERRRDGPAPPATAALRSRLTLQMPKRPAWSGYAEAEQDARDLDRRMIAVGGEYRFNSRGRLYARHELISSLGGAYALDAAQKQMSTVAGVDADLTKESHLFSEYRLADALDGRDAQAAVGLRNGWPLEGGVRLGTSFERVSPLAGGTAGPTTAASFSLDQAGDVPWKGSSRFEVRSSRASDSYLETMAAAVRIDSAWTALFRHHFDLTDARGAAGSARLRLQLGAAWRPGGAWDGLGRWEFHYDRDGLGPAGTALDGLADLGGLAGDRRRFAQILALQTAGRLDRNFSASVAWAGKRTRDEGADGATDGSAQWMRGRTTLDLARGWDAGLNASVLVGRSVADRRYGLGAEFGRRVGPGLWLSLGYNHFGYRDDELTGADWTRSGAYLRLRAKFDEQLFGVPDADEAPPAGGTR